MFLIILQRYSSQWLIKRLNVGWYVDIKSHNRGYIYIYIYLGHCARALFPISFPCFHCSFDMFALFRRLRYIQLFSRDEKLDYCSNRMNFSTIVSIIGILMRTLVTRLNYSLNFAQLSKNNANIFIIFILLRAL